MPTPTHSLRDALSQSQEITITVTGRKSGRKISNPVWFALEEDILYLLPVHGSETQWYKNVIKHPAIEIKIGATRGSFQAVPITDPKQVLLVVEKFRAKYGAGDVKKYYSKFGVAIRISLSSS